MGIGAPIVPPDSVVSALPTSQTDGRAILLGRACGLAAGTLLACGSVLVGATHVGESNSLAGDQAHLLSPVPSAPGTAGSTSAGYRADPPADPTAAAPDQVSAQGVNTDPAPTIQPRFERVRRNIPLSVDMPPDEPSRDSGTAPRPWESPPPAAGHAPQSPIAPVSPVLDPATEGVGRVAPVGGVLPTNPSTGPQKPSAQKPDPQKPDPQKPSAQNSGEKQAESPPNQRVNEGITAPREKRVNGTRIGPVETVKQVVAPVDNTIRPVIGPVVQSVVQPATRPATSLLTSLLPLR